MILRYFKRLYRLVALVVVVFLSTTIAQAEEYSVYVTRIDSDIYQDLYSKTIIITRYCYEFAYYEDALLIYNGSYSYNNKLIFRNGSSCDVKSVK
ncbi:hypothetical protein AGMMS49941_10880 [Deferribacterales bacterium]|nr:hypothetical protein AGMMS49941_10880 [Deferribacterales bacterium]